MVTRKYMDRPILCFRVSAANKVSMCFLSHDECDRPPLNVWSPATNQMSRVKKCPVFLFACLILAIFMVWASFQDVKYQKTNPGWYPLTNGPVSISYAG